MALKAVLFDFNGVILNDEAVHESLIGDLLIAENLRPAPDDFQKYCLGRSDRAALTDLLKSRGRMVSDHYLDQLIQNKALAYRNTLANMDQFPFFEGVVPLIESLKADQLQVGIVSGALRPDIASALEQVNLSHAIDLIVSADDVTESKPNPAGYLKALDILRLGPTECLVLEDTFIGIKAAKAAKIPVVGVAHTFPFHMLQRCTDWTVDYLHELEISRIQAVYAGERYPTALEA